MRYKWVQVQLYAGRSCTPGGQLYRQDHAPGGQLYRQDHAPGGQFYLQSMHKSGCQKTVHASEGQVLQKSNGPMKSYCTYSSIAHKDMNLQICKKLAGHVRLHCQKIYLITIMLTLVYVSKFSIPAFFLTKLFVAYRALHQHHQSHTAKFDRLL